MLGLLFAAGPVGSALFPLTSGWVSRVRHHGRAAALSAAGYGAAIVLFGLTGTLPLALIALAVAAVSA